MRTIFFVELATTTKLRKGDIGRYGSSPFRADAE